MNSFKVMFEKNEDATSYQATLINDTQTLGVLAFGPTQASMEAAYLRFVEQHGCETKTLIDNLTDIRAQTYENHEWTDHSKGYQPYRVEVIEGLPPGFVPPAG